MPRAALLGAGGLILLTIATVGAFRLTGLPIDDGIAPAEVLESRTLRFLDRADGSVAVVDAEGDRTIATLAPGTNGFVRGVMRGLARERRLDEVGAEPPFRLVRFADGRVSLIDTATGRRIELVAFGPTNLAAFAQLLPSGGST